MINPKEQFNAVTLRSGKELMNQKVVMPSPIEIQEEVEIKENDESIGSNGNNIAPNMNILLIDVSNPFTVPVNEREKKEMTYSEHIPYPHMLKSSEKEKHFERFMDMFKQIIMNIPLIEAQEKMQQYTKFMKDLLSSMKHLKDYAQVQLNIECYTIIQQKLPPKLNDK